MCSPFILLLFSITILMVHNDLLCEARDTITSENSLSDVNAETIISAGNIFELGFFTPEGNERRNRYVGIWYYNSTPRTVVWVANRDEPFLDTSGVIEIGEDGNLGVRFINRPFFPITSVDKSGNQSRTLQLLDNGNLILYNGDDPGTTLWQSFDHPTDTFLPGMKMDDAMELTSWSSPSDPSTGHYTFRQDGQGIYIIQEGSNVYWKSEESGTFFKISKSNTNVRPRIFTILSNFTKQSNVTISPGRGRYISYPPRTNYVDERLLMDSSGKIQYYRRNSDKKMQALVWSEPNDNCSIYQKCGKYATCINGKNPICQCLPGFDVVSMEDWNNRLYSDGCSRKLASCQQNTTITTQQDKFKYLKLQSVGGSDIVRFDSAQTEKECQDECLSTCKCKAYAYLTTNVTDRETGNIAPKCWIWSSDLVNLQVTENNNSIHLFARVPSSEGPASDMTQPTKSPRNEQKKRNVVFIILFAGVLPAVLCFGYILYRRRWISIRHDDSERARETNPVLFLYEQEADRIIFTDSSNTTSIDIPFYSFDSILLATDNFSDSNKLGQGGFGPVYKGKFPGGQEIAVKRLSSCSGQGIAEFRNEVILIAKLQHRNLVRLLGYCVKESEKILLYEYMPNKSLDAFIFDQHNCLLLNWKKRFDIILGIARGLLYLHHDSRLRIIHRDLKTSNILLDEEMNPKISDFGLARIVEGKSTESSTNKVVGTFGYMSPEYALDGKFSTKSDVFSFGVVVLEIISGKRNTGFYNPQEVLNLLGFAWRLWSGNKAFELVDDRMLEICDSEVMKCINIGLLCVQEDPNDRPPMSTVVVMLGSETNLIPLPTQPAFVVRRRLSSTTSSSSTKPDTLFRNELTITEIEGR